MARIPVLLVAEAYYEALDEVLAKHASAGVEELLRRVSLVKRAAGREYISKAVQGDLDETTAVDACHYADDLFAYATGIRKSETWERNGKTFEWHGSRSADGRFSRSTGGAKAAPGSFRQYAEKDVDTERKFGQRYAPGNLKQLNRLNQNLQRPDYAPGTTPEDRAAVDSYLGQYQATQDMQDELIQAFGKDKDKVRVFQMIENQDGSQRVLGPTPLTQAPKQWDPNYERQVSVAFDVAPGASPEAKELGRRINRLGAATGIENTSMPKAIADLAEQITSTDEENKTKRSLKRLNSLGTFLRATGMGPEKVHTVLNLVGGDDAQRLAGSLEPTAQRTYARYRGTEKRPDPELLRPFGSQEMELLDSALANGKQPREVADAVANMSGAVPAAIRRRKTSESDDQMRMGVRRDLGTKHLLDEMPIRAESQMGELARRAGVGLPSRGIIIDSDGDVVSQAVGAAGDHYLPFTPGGLARMDGGQYVRTRETGGFTPEDLRTLLMSNGRAAQVVSGSGVFDVELAPEVRGKRRFNDTTMGMVGRYENILDALAESGLYAVDLTPQEKADIRAEALEYSGGIENADYQKRKKQKEEALRNKRSELTTQDIEAIEADIDEAAKKNGISPREVADQKADAVERARDEKVRQYKLNAEGYDLALKTLQAYYPYDLRIANTTSLQDFAAQMGVGGKDDMGAALKERARASDAGYVPHGEVLTGTEQERREKGSWYKQRIKREEAASAPPPAGPDPLQQAAQGGAPPGEGGAGGAGAGGGVGGGGRGGLPPAANVLMARAGNVGRDARNSFSTNVGGALGTAANRKLIEGPDQKLLPLNQQTGTTALLSAIAIHGATNPQVMNEGLNQLTSQQIREITDPAMLASALGQLAEQNKLGTAYGKQLAPGGVADQTATTQAADALAADMKKMIASARLSDPNNFKPMTGTEADLNLPPSAMVVGDNLKNIRTKSQAQQVLADTATPEGWANKYLELAPHGSREADARVGNITEVLQGARGVRDSDDLDKFEATDDMASVLHALYGSAKGDAPGLSAAMRNTGNDAEAIRRLTGGKSAVTAKVFEEALGGDDRDPKVELLKRAEYQRLHKAQPRLRQAVQVPQGWLVPQRHPLDPPVSHR